MTANMRYNLDITRSGVQVSIDAYQGDTASRKVLFTFSNGSIPYEPTKDTLAVVYALKPDGKIIENRCTVTSDGIEVDLTSQFTKIAGTVACQLVLYCDNVIIASPEFTVKVRERWSFPVYEPLISAPEDWETNYSTYYTKNDGGFYESVAGESAPVWEDGKYYRLSNPTAESENEYGALLSVLAKAEAMFERSLKYAMMIEAGATKENISNKVTSISEESTDTQYPSAGAVYRVYNALIDALGEKADKTLVEQAAVGEPNRLIMSDGGKLVPSEYYTNDLRMLNHAIGDIYNGAEFLGNKVTSISEESTDTQYPSAGAVYRVYNALIDALREKADKTLVEQAAVGAPNRLIMSDGGKLVPSEYDTDNLRMLNSAIDGIQNVLLDKESSSNKVTSISEESTDNQYPSAKAVYDLFLPKRQTIVVDTPLWDIQPTIDGSLNEAFDIWKNAAYYITLKDTDGTALSDGRFKLCTAYDGYADAIDQIFTISGKSLSENMAVDFKTISEDRTSFEMRDAGVKDINIQTKNNKSQRYVFSIFHSCMTANAPGAKHLYLQDNIGKALRTSALYYSQVGKYSGVSGFLLTILDSKVLASFSKIGYTITINRTHVGLNVSLNALRVYDNQRVSYDANGYSDCSAGTEDFSNMELNQFSFESNNSYYFRNGTSITLEEFA